MKFTEAQRKIIDKYKELENEYGKGNVFLRYINDYWKVQFIIHKEGDTTYTKPAQQEKINGNILNSLEKKGILICCDNLHNEGIDPNGWRSFPEGVYCLGCRIKTEAA